MIGNKIKITTETGSSYVFNKNRGLVTKNESHVFRYGVVKATPDWAPTARELHEKGEGLTVTDWLDEYGEDRFPEVGECLYVAGFEGWYLSTPVVSIEEID